MGRWSIVNALLAIIVALLGFEIARTWARGLPPVDVPASASPAPAPAAPHEKGKRAAADKAGARGQQTPAALVAGIVEKDLFDPSRRAPTPDEVKVDTTPITKPPDNVVIVGVRILGKDREVFVSDGSQNPAIGRRLRAGDQVAGYTVKKIEATGVVLSSPSGDMVAMPLSLDKGKAGAGPGRAPTPGRPPQPAPVPAWPGQVPQPPGVSPALGPRGASPAAGVPVAPPTPIPQPPVPAVPQPAVQPVPGQVPGQTPQAQQLGTEARQKLDQLRQNEKRPGRRR
jgi:hypothetical protein